jgi:hypothetical protein
MELLYPRVMMRSIAGVGDLLIAVGDAGRVIEFDSGGTRTQIVPGASDLNAVWTEADGRAWAVGRDGFARRDLTGEWDFVPCPGARFLDVSGGDGRVFAAGEDGAVARIDVGSDCTVLHVAAETFSRVAVGRDRIWLATTRGVSVLMDDALSAEVTLPAGFSQPPWIIADGERLVVAGGPPASVVSPGRVVFERSDCGACERSLHRLAGAGVVVPYERLSVIPEFASSAWSSDGVTWWAIHLGRILRFPSAVDEHNPVLARQAGGWTHVVSTPQGFVAASGYFDSFVAMTAGDWTIGPADELRARGLRIERLISSRGGLFIIGDTGPDNTEGAPAPHGVVVRMTPDLRIESTLELEPFDYAAGVVHDGPRDLVCTFHGDLVPLDHRGVRTRVGDRDAAARLKWCCDGGSTSWYAWVDGTLEVHARDHVRRVHVDPMDDGERGAGPPECDDERVRFGDSTGLVECTSERCTRVTYDLPAGATAPVFFSPIRRGAVARDARGRLWLRDRNGRSWREVEASAPVLAFDDAGDSVLLLLRGGLVVRVHLN